MFSLLLILVSELQSVHLMFSEPQAQYSAAYWHVHVYNLPLSQCLNIQNWTYPFPTPLPNLRSLPPPLISALVINTLIHQFFKTEQRHFFFTLLSPWVCESTRDYIISASIFPHILCLHSNPSSQLAIPLALLPSPIHFPNCSQSEVFCYFKNFLFYLSF